MARSKDFISVWYNNVTGKHETVWNAYFKGLGARTYQVDSDYDFGSIDPADCAVEMYIAKQDQQPGLRLISTTRTLA